MNPRAVLKKNIKRRVSFGHPWIYDNEIHSCEPVKDGELVDVYSFSRQYVGRGYYNSSSVIRVRLLTRENRVIDRSFFEEKFSRAVSVRSVLVKNSDSFRVVFGEADGVPGLIMDKFSDYLVVQFNTLGINTFREEIMDSAVKLFSPAGVYEKSEGAALEKEGLEKTEGWIYGNGPELIPFLLNDIKFLADTKGQKTGFFLDQRDNALKLSRFSDGRRVLDLFSYTGNFAFHCLKGGASEVKLVDISERALEVAREIARLNGYTSKCEFTKGNVFDYLREGDLSRADIIVIDPPAMAKSSSSKSSALRGYKELNLRGIKSLKDGKLLATSSCTQIVPEEDWEKAIDKAFSDNKKLGVLVFKGEQPADHPRVTAIHETDYLKFRVFCVFTVAEF